MTKCDFCTQSTPNGKCRRDGYFEASWIREQYCEEAIGRMIEALKYSKGEE